MRLKITLNFAKGATWLLLQSRSLESFQSMDSVFVGPNSSFLDRDHVLTCSQVLGLNIVGSVASRRTRLVCTKSLACNVHYPMLVRTHD